jgi:Subtilase family
MTAAHRKWLIMLIVMTMALVAVPAFGVESGVVGLASDPTKPHTHDWVIVKLRPGMAAGALGEGGRGLFDRWIRMPVPPGVNAIDWAGNLAQRPGVEIAELEMKMELLSSPPLVSNDPFFLSGDQWNLERVQAPQSWLIATGTGVELAVLDGGVSLDPNPANRDGFCRAFVDEFDATRGVSGPGSAFDLDGHGSHVAGTAAQCTGNARRTAGMAPDASVMPIAVLEPTGTESSTAVLASGINWARTHGARVINMSLGCGCSSSIVSDAIGLAAGADIVMVAAAGNDGGSVLFPASDPRVLAIGATTSGDSIANYSSQGAAIDLVAPGGSGSNPVWQETFDPDTGVWGVYGIQGTSMAAPHAAGAAALLISAIPGATADRVRSLLRCTTDDLGVAGNDPTFGTGILQTRHALDEGLNPGGCSVDRVGVVETGSGVWRLWFDEAAYSQFFYGNPGDRGFVGDWDCDGVKTPGLYRQSDGFVYLRNSNNQGIADIRFFFGNPGDVPLAGDFNNDGCDTVSLYRPSEAKFYVINQLGSNDGGLGSAETSFFYGNLGDIPFVADWNGDGVDTPGLRRPSDGFVYMRNSNTEGIADFSFFYGNSGDVPFAGDWDGDDIDTMGLYRPSNGFIYLRNSNSTGIADQSWLGGFGLQAFRAGP